MSRIERPPTMDDARPTVFYRIVLENSRTALKTFRNKKQDAEIAELPHLAARGRVDYNRSRCDHAAYLQSHERRRTCHDRENSGKRQLSEED